MEDTNLNELEAAEQELSAEEIAAFDEGWGDDPDTAKAHDNPDLTEDEAENAQPAAEEDEPVDKPEEPAEEEAKEAKEPETAGQEKEEEGHQLFTLKFLHGERQVDLDEMTALAQKGADYDHVREERDRLRGDSAKLANYESFLKDMAGIGGTTVEELMESTRTRMLIQAAEAKGETLTEEDARAQVRAEARPKSEPKAEPAEAKAPEKTREQTQQEIIQRFVQLYPGVESKDIPQSVWNEADRVGDLITPYQKYENQKLRDELAQLKQNQKNRERSTGSRRTAGATTPKDAFDEGWNSSF